MPELSLPVTRTFGSTANSLGIKVSLRYTKISLQTWCDRFLTL
jgi:hypothetical protein